jgi:AcrB/AcrD/AcrF family protein
MALGLGEGAELRGPLAVTVIGGLSVSTVLTLIVIPVIYTLLDRKAFFPALATGQAGGGEDASGAEPETESSSAAPGSGFLPQPALGSPLSARFADGVEPGPVQTRQEL